MIGFAKVTHSANYSIVMNVVAMISHRDKAPVNALIAKTIEVCSKKSIPLLMYGVWGRRPGLKDFKVANGFERFEIPRYFVPLSRKGKLLLKLSLHRRLIDRIPEKLLIKLGDLRARWNEFRYGNHRTESGNGSTVAGAR